MPYQVKLPDIGEGVAEGEIVRWLVRAGESVREDQPLVEVMTDKANVEIPSPRTGTIEALHAEEGQVVPVGTVIVTIAVTGESTPAGPTSSPRDGAEPTGAEAQAAKPPVAGAAPQGAPTAGSGPTQATPAVRQLAKQLGVAIESVTGSGPAGRISAEDVQRAAGLGGVAVKIGPGSTPAPGGSTALEERVPLRGLRRRIADHMRRSLDTAAHFTFVAECDMTALVSHRNATKARAVQANVPLTYLAYVVRALIEPLRRFPLLNASLDDQASEVVVKRYYHVGIATATDDGLIVPVIHDADRKTLIELASEIQRLAKAARAGRLKVEELQGGTFTITSTGARGGLLATPILHHPQVAILGVHEVKLRPAVVDGQITAREMTNLSLSLDHRVVDGAIGADFLYTLVERLERPESWLDKEAVG